MSIPRLRERPFYAARLEGRRPRPWSLEDWEAFAAGGSDPYGGRLLPEAPPPPLSVQLEACDDPPLWVGLSPRELERWSRALEGIWSHYGVRAGECVALFDFGSSPLVGLAAASYAPHLRTGAADRLGLSVICNDGVASQADRMIEILERLRPAALVVRRDVLAPLEERLDRGVRLKEICRWIAVSEVEGVVSRAETERLARIAEVPVHRIVRADAAFFLAGECSSCGAFHVDPEGYALEALDAANVAVTARFARTCPAVRYRLEGGALAEGGCRTDASPRIRWD